MGNVVGPEWGQQVANILMQGGQWRQTQKLQEDSQAHDKQMRAFEAVLQARKEYATQLVDTIENAFRENEGDNPALKPMIVEAARILEQNMDAEPGSIDPEMFAAIWPALVSEEEKQAEVSTEIARRTKEDEIRRSAQDVEARDLAIDKGVYELFFQEQAVGTYAEDRARQIRAEEAGIDVQEAQAVGLGAQARQTEAETGFIAEMSRSRIGLNDAQARRLDAEADALANEMMAKAEGRLDPDQMKAVNDRARIRFLGVKSGDKAEVKKALRDVMLMYEEAGWPLPTSLIWKKDEPGFWARFGAKMGWGYTLGGDEYRLGDRAKTEYRLGEQTGATAIIGPRPRVITAEEQRRINATKRAPVTVEEVIAEEEAEDEASMGLFGVSPTPGPEDM